MKNNTETEINKIRLELYEETKSMSKEERIDRVNKLAQNLANQYGFIVMGSLNKSN